MTEITLHADEELVSELQTIANRHEATVEDVAREALAAYVRSHRRAEARTYSFIGIGHSGQPNLSARAQDILEQSADRREGWRLPK